MAEPALTPAPAAGPQPLNFTGAHVRPSFDVIELLPAAAADRLRALRQRRDDARSLNVPFEDVRQASMARVEAANALRWLQAHPSEGGFNLKPNDQQVIAATKTLEKATDELQRIKDRSEARARGWQAAAQALANVENWLRDGRTKWHGA